MTRNEYIASIMLEAADLLREDNKDVLDEDYSDYDVYGVINEAAIDGYDNLYLLQEAADGISSIKSSIKGLNKEKDFNKLKTTAVTALKNLEEWFFKIDPNKKFKALNAALKIIGSVLFTITSLGTGFNLVDPRHNQTASNLARKEVNRIQANYSKKFAGDGYLKMDVVNKIDKKWTVIFFILSAISMTLLAIIGNVVKNKYVKINMRDYESNKKTLTDQLNKIQSAIDKNKEKDTPESKEVVRALEKTKKNYVRAIKQLDDIKNRYAIEKEYE